jgi:hypothetical protein
MFGHLMLFWGPLEMEYLKTQMIVLSALINRKQFHVRRAFNWLFWKKYSASITQA